MGELETLVISGVKSSSMDLDTLLLNAIEQRGEMGASLTDIIQFVNQAYFESEISSGIDSLLSAGKISCSFGRYYLTESLDDDDDFSEYE